MQISLRLYASVRDLIGSRCVDVELPEGARIDDLKALLGERYPAVRPVLKTVVFAMDDEYVAADARLRDGAEVALIPPVSGGAGLFELTTDALEPRQGELLDLVRRGESGALVVFYGIVRNNAEGRRVLRLEYEAHETMAVRKMAEVAEQVKARFPEIAEIGIWHRVGTLEVGEASLLVALSSPHRKEGFEACHWAVDRIKEVVPVWKKEHFADGQSAWVAGHVVEAPEGAKH